MKDILSKLSSYNLSNYLLPGVIFVAAASKLTHYSFVQQDIVTGLFLYYFIGLVVSDSDPLPRVPRDVVKFVK